MSTRFATRSRTAFAATALTAALALTATACGSGGGSGSGGKDGSSGGGKGGGHAGTRTVTDAEGRHVKVPSHPEKVVTLSEPTLDASLALGVHPVGATAGRGQTGVSGYLTAKAGKMPTVATVAEPHLEKIAALHPDMILLDETVGAKRSVGKLQDIAPTVVTAKLKADWRSAFTATADALNRKPAAETWLKDFDGDVAATRGRLGADKGAVVSVVRWQNGAPSVVGKGKGHVGSVLTGLGLKRPADQQGAGVGHSEPISKEKLDTIDGDWLFFGTLGDRADGRKTYRQARKTPNFDKLKAERKHHVVAVDGSAWNSAGGPLAARVVLKDVADALTK